jgi:branched-chain amino acid transport system ATP-binding protein
MLWVDGLTARYGPVVAVRDLTWEVGEGQVVALLGPNGAGKTTTLSAVMGLVSPAAGHIVFEGTDVTRLGPEDTVRAGIALAPEGRRILRTLTVLENLTLGATFRADKAQVRKDLEELLERFPVLGDRRSQLAGTLSGGEAQQLAIARALMAKPRLLLLDEPTLGLAPQLVDQVFGVVEDLCREGLTVVLVDQNATRAMTLADRTYVLRQGQVVAEGTAADIGGAEGLAEAYLGQHAAAGGHHV